MPFPLALLGATSIIGGHAARIGITSAGARAFSGQFLQSLPFGAGYSLGTYLGFPKNYETKVNYSRNSNVYLNTMPYYQSRYGRTYSRYGRSYGSRYRGRYRRRYYRRYRRYY